MKYRLMQRARIETLEIWNYIAEDSEEAADEFLHQPEQRFRLLGSNPYAGRTRDELRLGYRSFPVGQYLILYRVDKKPSRSCMCCMDAAISNRVSIERGQPLLESSYTK
jgi:plasmid stabilization system protein ParE